MLVSLSIILIAAFNLFLTSNVSNICCFSDIDALRFETILSTILDGSFSCLILLIVSDEIFLLTDVNFSNLLTAVSARGNRSSSLVKTSF